MHIRAPASWRGSGTRAGGDGSGTPGARSRSASPRGGFRPGFVGKPHAEADVGRHRGDLFTLARKTSRRAPRQVIIGDLQTCRRGAAPAASRIPRRRQGRPRAAARGSGTLAGKREAGCLRCPDGHQPRSRDLNPERAADVDLSMDEDLALDPTARGRRQLQLAPCPAQKRPPGGSVSWSRRSEVGR